MILEILEFYEMDYLVFLEIYLWGFIFGVYEYVCIYIVFN